ncbi:surfactin synthase thioesterase subunit [Streptomyces sp. SLBN-118]|uniref:thioesterase II family protein n=1 Tax=Streptomyces sp. SLBN-118 TaxID=2768454 RepID=UPI00115482EE|nr:alpha/beta fold hydrolase [Streptomyces sp. SLBN-118]TQK51034.1 surfactin synthase thioesterase subunit [Streptomyces sp. SLBN-118]
MTPTRTAPIESPWIRRYQPAPADGVTLVCFPHAGGSATAFHALSRALAGRLDVVAVQYPGRQDRHREPAFEDLHELADAAFDAVVEAVGTDRPLALFGHSMGASVAFEVAARLERRAGVTPVSLFVSGRRAPSRHRSEDLHRKGDDALLREIRALDGTAQAALDDEDIVRMFLPSLRADYKAIERYRSAPGASVGCPLVALTGDNDPKTTVEEARAWQEHTTGPFDLRVFDGGHFYVSEQTDAVAEVLAARLGVAGVG